MIFHGLVRAWRLWLILLDYHLPDLTLWLPSGCRSMSCTLFETQFLIDGWRWASHSFLCHVRWMPLKPFVLMTRFDFECWPMTAQRFEVVQLWTLMSSCVFKTWWATRTHCLCVPVLSTCQVYPLLVLSFREINPLNYDEEQSGLANSRRHSYRCMLRSCWLLPGGDLTRGDSRFYEVSWSLLDLSYDES